MANVEIYQSGSLTIAKSGDKQIATCQIKENARALFKAAIDAVPNGGSLNIGKGRYVFSAPYALPLNPDGSNIFYCGIPIIDKGMHISGAGVGQTILQLAPGQRREGRHVALMLVRGKRGFDLGYSSFSLWGVTLEGDRARQSAEAPHDGEGLLLVGSQRSNGVFENLVFQNSHGAGMYLGNNGSGPGVNETVRNVIARNCAAEGVILDTCQHSRVEDCYFEKCGTGLCLHGNTDNLKRPFDVLNVAHIRTKDAPITIWDVNDVTLHDVQMDASGCSKAYGLLIRSSTQVRITNSFFRSSRRKANSYGGASYISTGDGPCDVTLKNCFLDGYYALHLVGEAHAWMEGGALSSAYADVYLRDIESVPVSAKADIEGVAMLGSKLHADVAQGSSCKMRFCYFEKAPKTAGPAEIICPVGG